VTTGPSVARICCGIRIPWKVEGGGNKFYVAVPHTVHACRTAHSRMNSGHAGCMGRAIHAVVDDACMQGVGNGADGCRQLGGHTWDDWAVSHACYSVRHRHIEFIFEGGGRESWW
jgi:hypothetical protein